ncbi:MAG TPA: ABC transporter ATP-binding protein [Bacteroidota bacterium]|nr:ABC transporter ATP-binding protein [Bacteroidota bacterium]
MQLVQVENLEVRADGGMKERILLKDISFDIATGERIAIVGESGAGKTTLLRAMTNLFPSGTGMKTSGRIFIGGKNLLDATKLLPRQARQTSGIRYIFQEPAHAFNPVLRIRSQIRYLLAEDHYNEDAFLHLLAEVGIEHPLRTIRQYPHQVSVGMLQRIIIALALSGSPALLLADEPLSAIDAIHRNRIMSILLEQCASRDIALLFATHDLRIARDHSQVTLVLYGGRLVEKSLSEELFSNPLHPYSKALLSRASDHSSPADRTVQTDRCTIGTGCTYYSRCPISSPSCKDEEPGAVILNATHEVRCPYSK